LQDQSWQIRNSQGRPLGLSHGVLFIVVQKGTTVGRKLLSGSVLQVISLFASALASFFLMPFIVHHLGDRLYGFWALAATTIGYYSLLDFGLSVAVSQFISVAIGRSETSECRAIFNTALRIQSLIGVVALLATGAIAFATPLLCHNPADVPVFWRVIVVLGVNAAITFPTKVYAGVLEAEFRFDIQSSLAILGVVLRTGLVFWAVWAGGGLLSLAWMTLLATLPITALQIWFARREAPWARIGSGGFELTRVKNFFSYSIYTFLTLLADVVRFQIDTILIAAFIGLEAVTHYRIAGLLAQYYIQIIAGSLGMLRPVFSRLHGAADSKRLEKTFFFGTKISLCTSIFLGLALIGWGKPFITRWMGVRYDDAYLPLVALSLAVFLDLCQKPSIDLLYATFKHRFYTYMNWAEGLLNLMFSLILVRPLGILGVAMGTLIGAFVIRIVVQPWWVCKATRTSYAVYIKFLAENLLRCGCLMGLTIALCAWGLRPGYPWLLSSAICATVVYGVLSLFLVFNGAERRQLLAALTNRRATQIEPAVAGATLG